MHLRVTETAEASLAEAVAEASNKATVVVLRYMAWQRYHFHWAKHNGSGEFILGICGLRVLWILTVFRAHPTFTNLMLVYPISQAVTGATIFMAGLIYTKKRGA